MVSFHVLGTCSGTEPMPGRHHTSLALEAGGDLYLFDCGENASYSAYTSDLDLMTLRAMFISHPHIDHTGGLANFFFTLSKLTGKLKLKEKYTDKPVFLPKRELWDTVYAFYQCTDGARGMKTSHPEPISDGKIYEDENLRVTALHNRHLKEDGMNGWHSYSFLIEIEGKRVVFSGDVNTPDELLPLIAGGCDLLFMETGHHAVADVCAFTNQAEVKRLCFIHHGREILGDPSAAETLAKSICKAPIRICEDGDVIRI